MKIKVTLFRASGKYYTEEDWELPTADEIVERGGSRGDYYAPQTAMRYSENFRQIDALGPVLIDSQEPWGYPGLIL
jgi:hypothetical protein